MRLTACTASLVCSVENTRCPVSAAVSTVAIVSGSRISPTRITSGDWRRMLRSEPYELRRIVPDFDLLHDRAAVGVLVLDRIFDGNDVVAPLGVDQVDQGGQRGSLAAAGRPGHQHQAVAALGQPRQRRRAGAAIRAWECAPAAAGCSPPACPAGSGYWRGTVRWAREQNKNPPICFAAVPRTGAHRAAARPARAHPRRKAGRRRAGPGCRSRAE